MQDYNWKQDSCSLHPVVIYTCEVSGKDLIISSLCIIIDDLEHNMFFVYEIQTIIAVFKRKVPPSWQCTLYKNCKNFINLCYNQKDFNLKAVWSFVATSYEKSSCNGIGGTIKCFLTRESLQFGHGNTFNNVENVLEFC